MKNMTIMSAAFVLVAAIPVVAVSSSDDKVGFNFFGFGASVQLPSSADDEDSDGISSNVAFDAETRALLKVGDAAKGKEIAANNKCNKCHSENGIAEDPADPNLAGQMASYTYKQLRDYRDQKRDDRSMYKRTKKLSNEDMAHLSAWYASLPVPERMGKASDATLELVNKGDPKRMIKACGSCHGRGGEGGMHDSATLNGMSQEYFVATMEAFKEGDRENDIYSRMRLIAEPLTEAEVTALADFYATQPPAEEE